MFDQHGLRLCSVFCQFKLLPCLWAVCSCTSTSHPGADPPLMDCLGSLEVRRTTSKSGMHELIPALIIIIIIIIIIVIIIAFKGAISDFLQSPNCAANCLQHVRSRCPGAIVCKSRETHQMLITCSMSCYVPHFTKRQLSY